MAPNHTTRGTSATEHAHHPAPPPPLHHRPHALSTNLYIEEERLKTFDGWPSNYVTPEELASNGFYYTGVDDVARCAFCGLEVCLMFGLFVLASTLMCDETDK